METSLRSRPSKAPPRKAQRTPTKLAKSGSSQRNKNRIDDKIKKRISTRYADISSPTQFSGVPALPNTIGLIPTSQEIISLQAGDEAVRDRSEFGEEARAIIDDRRLLSSEDFDPATYLKEKLANSTEAEIISLESSLRHVANDTSSELQHSVFKNYAEFVLISKEISVLENEMLELKELVSDYKSMPSTLHIPDPSSSSSSMMSTYKRSSIADLRVLYLNQMQTLHATIEGASKFVPTTPGRHVVEETENVFCLNAATYKVTGKVKFVVLDDAVLVARRRRRNAAMTSADGSGSTANEGKLVAERCWPLNEMLVLDTKDSASMSNVFKIRHGKETHVYRTESPTEKKALLSHFRTVAEGLSQRRRKEREGEHERRKSMWQGPGAISSDIPSVPEWISDLRRKGGELPGMESDAKEKAERDRRWVGEWSDDLTVAIALKEWNRAIDLIEQGQARVAVMRPLTNKLTHLRSQLISSLLTSLSYPSNRKTTVVNLISLLNRLKAGAAARNTFLQMRTNVIRGLTRKICFDGDIEIYVGQLSVVYFTGIKHTADWYLASFKDNEVASSFITWTKALMVEYGVTFRKQVYLKGLDKKVIEECIRITHAQSRKLLQEYGLDFRYMFDEILVKNHKRLPETKAGLSEDERREPGSTSIIKKPEQKRPTENTPGVTPIIPSPPCLNRRKSPGLTAKVIPHPLKNESLYASPSAVDAVLPSAGSKQESHILSPDSLTSTYSSRIENSPSNAPLFLSRQNPATLSAMRAWTPMSAGLQEQVTPPNSAPIPKTTITSLPPRTPFSAMPLRMRDRSDSVKSKDSFGSESHRTEREGAIYNERPPRSARASPAPRTKAGVPPRSANRPGSATGQRTPAAVAQHEGMI